MAVTTYTDHHDSDHSSRLGTWFSKVFARMVASREVAAQRYVATILRNVDDEKLAELGLTREEVNSRPHTPFIF